MKTLVSFLLLLNFGTAQSFVTKTTTSLPQAVLHRQPASGALPSAASSQKSSNIHINNISRGGALMTTSTSLGALPMVSQVLSWVTPNLQSGPLGVVALSAVTWSVVLPLTLYKKVWGIGVAYGFSVCAAGLALLQLVSNADPMSASSLLAKACVAYGARLGGYVLLRDLVRKKPSAVKNGSVVSRVTFSLSLSLFYALLTTPALYAMRHPSESVVSMAGAVQAIVGLSLEAIADAQKFLVKSKNNHAEGDFVGPTGGTFAISRHPNYLGEILFWVGLFVGGAPSFGKHAVAWICSGLGLMGILSIMLKATSGLEKRQSEKYTGQEKYDTWKSKVKYPLFPFVSS